MPLSGFKKAVKAAPEDSVDVVLEKDATAAAVQAAADPLLPEEDPSVKRNAGWWDILYHSITAMVGAGVLGLPSALSHLGWAGGVIFLVFSIWVSWYTYRLLVLMHEVPDLGSKAGLRRLDRYDQLAQYILGKRKGKLVLLPFQLAVLVGLAITYTVVGGQDLAAFAELITPAGGPRLGGSWAYFLMFGALQVMLSMLPSLHDARLVSLLGALMSAAYSLIALVMSATVRPGPEINYDPGAVKRSTLERVMGVFNALTTIFFAYGGHNIALEIQATVPISKQHPTSVPIMMRGVNVTFVVTAVCYFGVSLSGFYAFGTGVADNVLLAFEGTSHAWVIAAANFMVVLHVAAAFQVYTQPVYALIEARLRSIKGTDNLPVLLQFGLRITYVGIVTLVALLIPFFGALMGLVGAIAVTPTTFLLPPLFWLLYKKPSRWGLEWGVNWALVYVCGILGVLGCIGSLYSIVLGWASFKIFAS